MKLQREHLLLTPRQSSMSQCHKTGQTRHLRVHLGKTRSRVLEFHNFKGALARSGKISVFEGKQLQGNVHPCVPKNPLCRKK